MASLGKLLVELSADTAAFNKDMGRAVRTMNSSSRRIEGSGKRIERTFSGMTRAAKTFAGILGTSLILRGAQAQITQADALAKLSTRLGESTEALSEYSFVAERAGVAQSNFGRALQVQERLISDAAAGYGQARDALKELKLSPSELANLTPTERFRELGDALLEIEDESRRVALAQKVWQSEGVQLLQVVNQGNAAIDEQIDLARRLGVTLTEDAAASAEQAADDMQQLSAATGAFSRDLALLLASPAATFFQGLSDSLAIARFQIENITNSTSRARLQDVVDGMAASVEQIADLQDDIKKARTAIDSGLLADTTLEKIRLKKLEGDMDAARATYDKLKKAYDEMAGIDDKPDIVITGGAGNQGGDLPDKNREVAETAEDAADAYGLMTFGLFEATKRAEEFEDAFAEVDRTALGVGNAVANTFENAVFNIRKASDALGVLEAGLIDIAQVLLRQYATGPLAASIAGAFAGGGGGGTSVGTTGQYPNFFQGLFADGGPLRPGRAAIVGENGPEMIVPKTSGTVIPNDQLGGESAVINFTVNAIDAQSFQAALAQNERLITGMVRKGFARRGNRVDL